MLSPKRKKILKLSAVLAVILLLGVAVCFAGCEFASMLSDSSPTNDEGSSHPDSAEIPGDDVPSDDVQNENPEPPAPVFRNVLTGLETTSELAALRPVSICIGNTAYALPQYGLSSADILVEAPIEDGTTRLMMITTDYEHIATVGSVRATRSYLTEMAAYFDCIQLYNGTTDKGESVVYENLDTLDYATRNLYGVYYTDDMRTDPHNLMTNGTLITNGIRRFSFETTQRGNGIVTPYAIDPDAAPLSGSRAMSVSLPFSETHRVSYEYDAEVGAYVRYQYGEMQTDANNGQAITFEHLFLLFTTTVVTDRADGKQLDMCLSDGGTGYYLADGAAVAISWTKTADGTLCFTAEDGSLLSISCGNSYIGLLPVSAAADISIS